MCALGRAAGGPYAGWAAAGIAALYPGIWVNDGLIMSETITSIAVVGALLLALRLARRPSLGNAIGAGVFAGLACLGRAELVLFVPLLLLPAAWFGARAVAVATGNYDLAALEPHRPDALFADLSDTDAVVASLVQR